MKQKGHHGLVSQLNLCDFIWYEFTILVKFIDISYQKEEMQRLNHHLIHVLHHSSGLLHIDCMFSILSYWFKLVNFQIAGDGHRTVTGEEGRCTLDVSPGGKPSCSWHIRIRNYPARIRNLSPFSLFFKKKFEVSGGKLFKFSADSYPYLKARMLVFIVFPHACQYISKTSSWYFKTKAIDYVHTDFSHLHDASVGRALGFCRYNSIIVSSVLCSWLWSILPLDLGYLPWIVLNLRSQTCLL